MRRTLQQPRAAAPRPGFPARGRCATLRSMPAPERDAPVRFPPGFLWGASTSAHQVEGGNVANDWWRFEQRAGAIRGGDRSGEACRHWERFDEDFARCAACGHTMHRLSLEWSRIEPAPGRTDA